MPDKIYKIPSNACIGHVHLKVSNIDRALKFYCDLLGLELITTYGKEAAFISAGGYHHHIGLNVWHTKDQPPAPRNFPGLFHTAILYPTRKDLAEILSRLQYNSYPLTGAADHGVSEAIYLDDPDKNGVELYWDKPRSQWPTNPDGSLIMYTRPLDLGEILNELKS
jgi:catechol 2,3-dioxygenase